MSCTTFCARPVQQPEPKVPADDCLACGFLPIARADARVIILGSMPGRASLAAAQYYAHPRNAFWPILGHLLNFSPTLDAESRYALLRDNGIALWDVLQQCKRPGSLDAAIEKSSAIDNDFTGFFRQHPAITQIFFNGAHAEKCFRRVRHTQFLPDKLHYRRLPSTSPANAGSSFAQKLSAWSVIRDVLAHQTEGREYIQARTSKEINPGR